MGVAVAEFVHPNGVLYNMLLTKLFRRDTEVLAGQNKTSHHMSYIILTIGDVCVLVETARLQLEGIE